MRRILLATVLLGACPAMAQTVTVTPLPVPFASYVTDHSDQFEFSNLSPVFGGTGSEISDARDAFGGVNPTTGEPGSYLFTSFGLPGGTQELSFNTLAPVTISGFNLYLAEDAGGARRFTFVRLLGSVDNITFTNLGNITFPDSYASNHGSDFIRVQSTFASQTLQYFRFQGQDIQAFVGGRIVELDAISGATGPGAVPEPASWALMIMGFGAVGAAMRGRGRTRLLTI